MKKAVFEVVLLIALPASGKSELRNLLSNMDKARLREEFHIGESLQLDDFPYVHMMRRIDTELEAMGQNRLFYPGETPFYDGRDWGTLCQLLNEDYFDLINRNVSKPDSAALHLFERIDAAAAKAGVTRRLGALDENIRIELAKKLEAEAQAMHDNKRAGYADSLDGKTIIIECARGGPDGADMPLTGTFGYQYSLKQFCPEILEKAVVLYIWVSPEESRRKNADRADPNDPGSNLHHGVPMAVMLGDYGCDDIMYLAANSDIPGTLAVNVRGKTYHLPLGVFDNRADKTSFLRESPDKWDEARLREVTGALGEATDVMARSYGA